MNVTVKEIAPAGATSDTLVIGCVETQRGKLPGSLGNLDKAVGGAIQRVMGTGDFKGKAAQSSVLYPGKRVQRIVLVGLGKKEDLTRDTLRRAMAQAGRIAAQTGARELAVHIPLESRGGLTQRTRAQVITEGVQQGVWSFNQYKVASKSTRTPRSLVLVVDKDQRRDALRGRKIGIATAAGQALARELQALPGNTCTPSYLAERAGELGRKYGFKVSVMGRRQLDRAGMGALLAVAQGSAQEPRLIILEYEGAAGTKPVGLVGKGVTFDSGGISIKPALNMEEMKYDMSGAAAVLGTFETIGRLKPKANVVGVIPSTENLPSGTAVKPGDIVKSHLGKTIEVINTDAEGRLILADALSFVRKFEPACVLDIATLTGAIVIGLGNHATGIMGNDDRLLDEVRVAGDRAGERCWPLPLWDVYRKQIQSSVADVKNTGGRSAGSITAGWFLREFVDGFPWCHLDVAGTAYTDDDAPHMAKGPTGVGVRLFTEFILGRA